MPGDPDLLEKVARLQKEAESFRRQEQRDELLLEQLWEKLGEDYKCASQEQVKNLLRKLKKEETQLRASADKKMGEYRRKFGDEGDV